MIDLWQYLWRILFMAVLLLCSAFFSGSETAFFHLSHRQVHLFSRSRNRAESLIAEILKSPNRFLTTLLFGNMLVNVTFFSLAGILSVQLNRQWGPAAAAAAAVLSFISLIMFGELLPKSLAYANTALYARLAAIPCWVLLVSLGRALTAVDYLVIQPVSRLILGAAIHAPRPTTVGTRDFRLLLDSSRKQGLISFEENQLLMEVLKLGHLKVRDIMTPRVDMVTVEVSLPAEELQRLLRQGKQKIIPVYKDTFDNIIGLVTLRDLLLNPDKPVRKLLRPVRFVPEQQPVEKFLAFLRDQHVDRALVVDEYGGIAGIAGLDDLVEELLGIADHPGLAEPVETIGPLTYRLAAELSIHDWTDAFGINPDQNRYTTVGGMVTALLDKIARPGDTVSWKNMKFTVESVKKNRIQTLIFSLEPHTPEPDSKKKPG